MQNCEEHHWEQDKDERLDVEEYQREEEIVTAVFEQQESEEFLGELDSRQALVKSQSGRRCVGD